MSADKKTWGVRRFDEYGADAGWRTPKGRYTTNLSKAERQDEAEARATMDHLCGLGGDTRGPWRFALEQFPVG